MMHMSGIYYLNSKVIVVTACTRCGHDVLKHEYIPSNDNWVPSPTNKNTYCHDCANWCQ